MTLVASAAEHQALEERVRKLELRTSLEALYPTGIVPLSKLPCGSRKARRLAEDGKLPVFTIGGGRRLYCRIADFVALAAPVAPKPKTAKPEPGEVEACGDGAGYAERNLALLTKGRAA